MSPFIIHPKARMISGLYFSKTIFIINGNSKAPGDSMKPILEILSPEWSIKSVAMLPVIYLWYEVETIIVFLFASLKRSE